MTDLEKFRKVFTEMGLLVETEKRDDKIILRTRSRLRNDSLFFNESGEFTGEHNWGSSELQPPMIDRKCSCGRLWLVEDGVTVWSPKDLKNRRKAFKRLGLSHPGIGVRK